MGLVGPRVGECLRARCRHAGPLTRRPIYAVSTKQRYGSLSQKHSQLNSIIFEPISGPTNRPVRHFRIWESEQKTARLLRRDYIRRVVPGREAWARVGRDTYVVPGLLFPPCFGQLGRNSPRVRPLAFCEERRILRKASFPSPPGSGPKPLQRASEGLRSFEAPISGSTVSIRYPRLLRPRLIFAFECTRYSSLPRYPPSLAPAGRSALSPSLRPEQ